MLNRGTVSSSGGIGVDLTAGGLVVNGESGSSAGLISGSGVGVDGAGVTTCLDHNSPHFTEGGGHPPEKGHSWTDGDLVLPPPLFAHLQSAFTPVVHTKR